MRFIIFLFGFASSLHSQHYNIYVLGLHAADVVQERETAGLIKYTTQNRGIFDLIWPASNFYTTNYDTLNFGFINYEKKIYQGSDKNTISGKLNPEGYLVYDKKLKLKVPESTHNILTLLAMVQYRDRNLLDGVWYNYEHDAMLGRARFLFNDSVNVWYNGDSLLCDHYRFDISIEDSSKQIKSPDYFMNNLLNDGIVRELWISKTPPKNIIKASINFGYFVITAKIRDSK